MNPYYFAQMFEEMNWAVVVPMANEEAEFSPFVEAVTNELNTLRTGKVYFVVDSVSKDRTKELCEELSKKDSRFITIWAPENKNVVDAYLRGYKEAVKNGHEFIIEMDAGMSHDPKSLPVFLEKLHDGYECVFGSRFIKGGGLKDAPAKRKLLSKGGTLLSNILLGSNLYDMTSGYQGFTKRVVEEFLRYELKSKAHFYQTELRYLLRKNKQIEVPIQYKAPSPRVSNNAIKNSLSTLVYYFWRRLSFRPISL
jgi:dolichol-phosphate mannosyltransferase